jgi:hypothetical protein
MAVIWEELLLQTLRNVISIWMSPCAEDWWSGFWVKWPVFFILDWSVQRTSDPDCPDFDWNEFLYLRYLVWEDPYCRRVQYGIGLKGLCTCIMWIWFEWNLYCFALNGPMHSRHLSSWWYFCGTHTCIL